MSLLAGSIVRSARRTSALRPLLPSTRQQTKPSTNPADIKRPNSAAVKRSAYFSTMSVFKSDAPAPIGGRQFDPEIKDMASYIHNYKIDSDLAVSADHLVGSKFGVLTAHISSMRLLATFSSIQLAVD